MAAGPLVDVGVAGDEEHDVDELRSQPEVAAGWLRLAHARDEGFPGHRAVGGYSASRHGRSGCGRG